jgi:DNA-binding phage protein
MARRSKDWNEGLAKDLREAGFAAQFLNASLAEGISLQLALGKVIRTIGIKEFSRKAKILGPNILRAINPHHNPTQETLNRLLKPLGLRLTVMPIKEERRRPKKAA